MREDIIKDLQQYSSREKSKILQRFFKTGKGEYGEGDIFVGITVPNIRSVAKKYYKEISFDELNDFVSSEIHEFRMFGLLTLTYKFEKAGEKLKEEIYNYYLKNTKYINNWDLVDVTAPKIVGKYLKDRPRDILFELVKSENMWEQRIAILSTFVFIKNDQFEEILDFSKKLINHEHDLIHKALGWMLREVGKRDIDVLRKFLDEYHTAMSRVMLRYAIEKLEKSERDEYMGRA
jgi:3-methyladenine DNA glycosylase AlkD